MPEIPNTEITTGPELNRAQQETANRMKWLVIGTRNATPTPQIPGPESTNGFRVAKLLIRASCFEEFKDNTAAKASFIAANERLIEKALATINGSIASDLDLKKAFDTIEKMAKESVLAISAHPNYLDLLTTSLDSFEPKKIEEYFGVLYGEIKPIINDMTILERLNKLK